MRELNESYVHSNGPNDGEDSSIQASVIEDKYHVAHLTSGSTKCMVQVSAEHYSNLAWDAWSSKMIVWKLPEKWSTTKERICEAEKEKREKISILIFYAPPRPQTHHDVPKNRKGRERVDIRKRLKPLMHLQQWVLRFTVHKQYHLSTQQVYCKSLLQFLPWRFEQNTMELKRVYRQQGAAKRLVW